MDTQIHNIYDELNRRAEELHEELSSFRRDMHAHPEVGWTEMRTTSLIARKLKEIGCDEILLGEEVCDRASRMGVPAEDILAEHYKLAADSGADPEYLPYTKGGMTGVIGILHCGEGPVVAMRFDIDALSVQETCDSSHLPETGGFRSQYEGVMHACGHDGHLTIGIGTAAVLCALREQLHGTIKFIFQPAEEGVRGAKAVVEKGHLDDVQYLFGAHMGGDAELRAAAVGVGPNRTLATTKMDVTFHGKPAHACFAPEEGNNAMLAMATAILNLNAIPRFGQAATRINVGKVEAGTGRNVICDRAFMQMEVRGMTSEANDYMQQYAERIIAAAAQMHGCTYEITIQGEAKGDVNSPELMGRLIEVCRDKMQLKVIELPDNPNGGVSEDYSVMADRVRAHGGQSCYFQNMSALSANIHSDHFDFKEEALVNGVKAFAGIAAEIMGDNMSVIAPEIKSSNHKQ